MAQPIEKTKERSGLFNGIVQVIFFIGFYFYLWLRIDPSLYFQIQEPVFLLTRPFFSQFLSYPGGLVDYTAAFLSQFYYYPWAGAFVLTVITLLICLTTKWIIQASGKKSGFLHLTPVIFLIIMYSRYEHPMAFSVGLLIALIFSGFYIRIRPKNSLLSMLIYLVLAVILHVIAAGPFMLFMVIGVLFELKNRQRTVLQKLVFTAVSAIFLGFWPLLSANGLFIVSLPDAYLHGISTHQVYKLPYANYLLYLLFPVILAITLITGIKSKQAADRNNYTLAALLIVVLLTGLTAFFTFDRANHHLLKIDYYARRHMWAQVLREAEKDPVMNQLILFHINRALFHLGRLPDHMFDYPQLSGPDALVIPKEARLITPLLRSDIFLELGQIGEAHHWALEALTVKGATPWNLKRLAVINIVKGEKEAALKFIRLLEHTLLFKSWGKHYREQLLNSASAPPDPQLVNLKSLYVKNDFIAMTNNPELDMIALLKQNKNNKMAFEYLMAHYLLTGQLTQFISNLPGKTSMGHYRIPKNYQEALMVFYDQKGQLNENLKRFNVETIKSFNTFKDIMNRYKGNKKDAARLMTPDLKKTYMYYLLYIRARKH